MKENTIRSIESKEIIIPVPELIIFDMDGTLIDNPEFYSTVFSGTLNTTIGEEKGQYGLEMLSYYRQNFEGKGEFALFGLGIPFQKWADKLITAPLDLIQPQPEIVQKIRNLKTKKVVYTGSPRELALRMLRRVGFEPDSDFEEVFGWKEPEVFPLKWTCSPFVFQSIAQKFNSNSTQTMSVGDNWESDLLPARQIGMPTVQIRKNTGNPDYRFPTVTQLIDSMKGGD